MKSQTLYIVTKGIFKGTIFRGSPIVICEEKRVWNDDSAGQAFLAENCEIYKG